LKTQATLLTALLALTFPLAHADGPSFDSLSNDLKNKRVIENYKAEGVQIYECEGGKWVFKGPVAALKDSSGKVVAIHHSSANCGDAKGPRPPAWETFDGSEIVGAKLAAKEVPGSIPSLVVKINQNNGKGSLAQATHLLRTKTFGGDSPSAAFCRPDAEGKRQSVPYRAEYVLIDSLGEGPNRASGAAGATDAKAGAGAAH
jgi:hypothetical protein